MPPKARSAKLEGNKGAMAAMKAIMKLEGNDGGLCSKKLAAEMEETAEAAEAAEAAPITAAPIVMAGLQTLDTHFVEKVVSFLIPGVSDAPDVSSLCAMRFTCKVSIKPTSSMLLKPIKPTSSMSVYDTHLHLI
jgi:hypothetical protein